MKNWTWKQWTALGLCAAFIVTLIILHLVQPGVSYAFAECMSAVAFVLGAVTGYLFKIKKQ